LQIRNSWVAPVPICANGAQRLWDVRARVRPKRFDALIRPEPAHEIVPMTPTSLRIGTAGWSIPAETSPAFPTGATRLERYSGSFGAAEINSSFHRPHRVSTYQRWAAAVPESFRFAVKVPKEITHQRKLSGVEDLLDAFLSEVAGLGGTLGPLLVQLPPSLAFEAGMAERFLRDLRDRVQGLIACEPRHPSWFEPDADALLVQFRIGRVAADPARVPQAGRAGGWPGLTYFRLHGSPRVYHSPYEDAAIQSVVTQLHLRSESGGEGWCIFDNTASGAATENALTAQRMAQARL
jgi:uncharacterized protein YecE (DUF72 family)